MTEVMMVVSECFPGTREKSGAMSETMGPEKSMPITVMMPTITITAAITLFASRQVSPSLFLVR